MQGYETRAAAGCTVGTDLHGSRVYYTAVVGAPQEWCECRVSLRTHAAFHETTPAHAERPNPDPHTHPLIHPHLFLSPHPISSTKSPKSSTHSYHVPPYTITHPLFSHLPPYSSHPLFLSPPILQIPQLIPLTPTQKSSH